MYERKQVFCVYTYFYDSSLWGPAFDGLSDAFGAASEVLSDASEAYGTVSEALPADFETILACLAGARLRSFLSQL